MITSASFLVSQCFVLQELVDAVWDEDRWGSNGIGAWGWILSHVFVCLLCLLCPILNLTLLFLLSACYGNAFAKKEFPILSSGHGVTHRQQHHRGLDDFAGRSGLAKRLLDAMPATGQKRQFQQGWISMKSFGQLKNWRNIFNDLLVKTLKMPFHQFQIWARNETTGQRSEQVILNSCIEHSSEWEKQTSNNWYRIAKSSKTWPNPTPQKKQGYIGIGGGWMMVLICGWSTLRTSQPQPRHLVSHPVEPRNTKLQWFLKSHALATGRFWKVPWKYLKMKISTCKSIDDFESTNGIPFFNIQGKWLKYWSTASPS